MNKKREMDFLEVGIMKMKYKNYIVFYEQEKRHKMDFLEVGIMKM